VGSGGDKNRNGNRGGETKDERKRRHKKIIFLPSL
jgi:hypothetical protein